MFYLFSIGTFCGHVGREFGRSRHIVYALGMLPMVSNDAGNVHFSAMTSCTLAVVCVDSWSCNGAMFYD